MAALELIYGINPVVEALAGRHRRPVELLVAEGPSPRLQELLRAAEVGGVTVRRVERRELDRCAGHGRHQGVALKVEPFAYQDLEDALQAWRDSGGPALFLVLDGITDPHNLGALLRTAEAAGCHGVIVPKDRACPVTAVVDKTSAGALAHIRLCQVTNLARCLDQFKQAGVWVYGLAGEVGAQPLHAADLTGHVALVVGSEGSGLRPNVRSHCDALLAIPMRGSVASLNASVAAGIALFECVRQQSSMAAG